MALSIVAADLRTGREQDRALNRRARMPRHNLSQNFSSLTNICDISRVPRGTQRLTWINDMILPID